MPPRIFPNRHHPHLGDPRLGDDDDKDRRGGNVADVSVETKPKTKRPSLYKVLLLNDDYTPMEFVVYILQRFFNKNHDRAFDIMLTVHNKGVAVVGVYPFEIAETKVTQVMDCARSNQHPLQCTMEKE
jgi:ATP-dependent Clp protease adaptor protein ClpS